ncbi:ASCH domain-containing protein [Methylomonas sp. EFPC1]|uniref:ASCH domain-containing protein n=1 Tax=Methylomonas sp. EFPC1 TaxID=2812647 RepID=UPI0019677330|nr:ASCH domain-containing protein [Methylomonas sp. EFPC1]QSB01652.1 ASCH domain-containing protein [Methylomonas sp. EFPC1]
MTEYPEKSCSIDRLVRHPKLVVATLAGDKTQQRRDGLYAYPGETFVLEDVVFEVTSVERQRIGDMSDADARAEGYPNLAMYKDLILKMHSGMEWNEDGLVWVHSFKRQQPE